MIKVSGSRMTHRVSHKIDRCGTHEHTFGDLLNCSYRKQSDVYKVYRVYDRYIWSVSPVMVAGSDGCEFQVCSSTYSTAHGPALSGENRLVNICWFSKLSVLRCYKFERLADSYLGGSTQNWSDSCSHWRWSSDEPLKVDHATPKMLKL